MEGKQSSLTFREALWVCACVAMFATLVFGSIIGTAWFLPSPWYLCGAIPATAFYWLLQRESVVETAVLFLIMLLCCWAVRQPIQSLREYISSESHAKAIVIES